MTEEPIPVTMPPANIEAEEACLGAFLINSGLDNVAIPDPADFYVQRNRWICEAIINIKRAGRQVDFMTVSEELESIGKLNQVGGAAYLARLIDVTPTSIHAESYADIIRDRAQRRRMLEIASNLAKSAYNLDCVPDQTIGRIATDLANSARPKGGAQHASIFASRHYDRISQLAAGERKIQRIPTGFLDFDKCLGGGLRIPEMLLLLGRPGLGKTKFILQLGFNMGRHCPGAIYEMETDEDQIMDREFSRRTKIVDNHFENGSLTGEEWPVYIREVESMADAEKTQVYLDFNCGWTTTTLRADLARLKAERGIRWYMVDYMKFLRDSYGKDEIERLNNISGRLKQINRELDLASVVIHSMNKEGLKTQRPDLANMSQGADIAFDTDKVLFMLPHVPQAGEAERENYRTFVFQKSRSRLNQLLFTLQAQREYPGFVDVVSARVAAQERS